MTQLEAPRKPVRLGLRANLPQFVLLTTVWQRSFPNASRLIGAA